MQHISKLPYYNLSSYLHKTYKTSVGKVCLDGGFTCPNRDGTCGVGGCLFCGEYGAGERLYSGLSIEEQAQYMMSHPGRRKKFIAYFQNFTNTYAPVSVLRQRYDAALTDPRVIVLSVGTRPDCLAPDTVALLASYRSRADVWVELGLQTANDRTAERIRRGYRRQVFEDAVNRLRAAGLPFIVHMMIGLPGENAADVADTADYIASFAPFGVKIHATYVMRGTALADWYREGRYTPLTEEEYVTLAADTLTRLPPQTVIHRLTGDCREDLLIAPVWNTGKGQILTAIQNKMKASGLTQGCRSGGKNVYGI